MPPKTAVQPKHEECSRLIVVETKVEYIEEAIKNNAEQLRSIDKKVDGISNHIAQQTGAIPTLEKSVYVLLDRLDANDKETYKASTKAKIAWAVISAILTGLLLMMIRSVIGL